MSEEKVSAVLGKQEKLSDTIVDKNLTISTKLSTEQLICKTPQESPNSSVKSLRNEEIKQRKSNRSNNTYNSLLYLGVSQILFGLLMVAFGALVLVHEAKLANLRGGLWGGCLSVVSGTTGVLAAAKSWCPLKNNAQKIAHTVFLASSLICVAVSQLVFVFAATGLARDIQKSYTDTEDEEFLESKDFLSNIPTNYLPLLSNTGLLIVSGVQFICAVISSYRSSRSLCPCFRRGNETQKKSYQFDNKDAFVNSWLGKQPISPPLYVVAAPSSLGKQSPLSIAPVLRLPPPPPLMGYPLIPAPLGPIPSPIIRPFPKEMLHHKHKRYHMIDHHRTHPAMRKPRKYKSKSREKQITTEDVVRTYTGLDRTIAEEFIEICDSHNNSLSSEISCQSSCHSSECTCASNSNTSNNCNSST
ncbi:hypothetical protein FQA39_LY04376 [Lamprigera yunnana]|nr:hypothetical protein FQA39_LY04376 [Lamprigera yunnana]